MVFHCFGSLYFYYQLPWLLWDDEGIPCTSWHGEFNSICSNHNVFSLNSVGSNNEVNFNVSAVLIFLGLDLHPGNCARRPLFRL